MDWAEPPNYPSLNVPEAPDLPGPVLNIPKADLPSYRPLVVPPNTLRPPPGIEGINVSDEPPEKEEGVAPKPEARIIPPIPPEAQIVEVPFTELEVPLPSTIILTTAITTAFVSVGATLVANSLFKYIVMVSKPIIKQVWNKLTRKSQTVKRF
jgi:hypothetical protein